MHAIHALGTPKLTPSLVPQWSYIDVCVYGGPSRQDALRTFRMGHKDVGALRLANSPTRRADHLARFAVICGLETARRNIATLIEQDFSMVIVDEVHRVKNPDKETTIAVRRFPAKLRYGLTGTLVFGDAPLASIC